MPYTRLLSKSAAADINKSPYTVSDGDLEALQQCRAFQIVRDFLASDQGES
jgi:hypothetical protein